MDESCDGGSEFTEALSVAVDSLVLFHLQSQQQQQQQQQNNNNDKNPVIFEGTLRTKATLFSSKILEERGFEPVEELSQDMATHISKYDACLEHYARRSIQSSSSTRDRALQIVALLGRLDPEVQQEAAKKKKTNVLDDGGEDEYDPWANIKIRR
jgi:predicted amidophosphoribosyltransferase